MDAGTFKVGCREYTVSIEKAESAPLDDRQKVEALKAGLSGGHSFKNYALDVLARARELDKAE